MLSMESKFIKLYKFPLCNITVSRIWTFPRDHWHLRYWRRPVGISGQSFGWPWLCHIGSSLLWLWWSSQEIWRDTPGIFWRSPVLHAPTHPGSPAVLILLFRTTSRGLSLCTHLCPVHGAALLFFQRLLLETSLVLVPKAPKAPSPFFVRWLDNAEFTVKVTWNFISRN